MLIATADKAQQQHAALVRPRS